MMTSSSATDNTFLSSLSSFLCRKLLRHKLLRHISCGSSEKRRPTKQDPPRKSEKLVDLLHLSEIHERREVDVETGRKADALERMKEVVRDLQFRGDEGEGKKKEGAVSVRLLSKEDGEARSLLGAIPPLVGMIDSSDDDTKINALYALLNLGIGNDANKAAIVKAGAVHKMLKLIESGPDSNEGNNLMISEAIVANFLGLSASDFNKSIIGSSSAMPFLVNKLVDLDRKSSAQAKLDALRALYNLSILPSNVNSILETGLIPFLVNYLGDMNVSDRILLILSNVVSTSEGRKAVSAVRDAFTVLVDVLSWTDFPGCQEKASYVLMVMAHKAYGDKQAMIDAGIMSALLELTLLGSTLAQERASRILECLRVDKGKQTLENYGGRSFAAVSAPIYSSTSTSAISKGGANECLEEENMMSDEEKAVKQLVQQSLQNNMRRIVKRANLPQEFIPSDHLKSLTASSTSKSLPF